MCMYYECMLLRCCVLRWCCVGACCVGALVLRCGFVALLRFACYVFALLCIACIARYACTVLRNCILNVAYCVIAEISDIPYCHCRRTTASVLLCMRLAFVLCGCVYCCGLRLLAFTTVAGRVCCGRCVAPALRLLLRLLRFYAACC